MMNREQIINELKKYFNISELVCNHTYGVWGEQGWVFLDTKLLHTLLIVRRDILNVGIYVNTSTLTQRGLRCNICQLVKDKTKKNNLYLSAHIFGKAIDFHTKELDASQCRAKIIEKQSLLPYNIRLEKDVSWVHLDVMPFSNNKIYIF